MLCPSLFLFIPLFVCLCAQILLFAQLVGIRERSATNVWITFSQALEAFFLLDMFVQIVAFGTDAYLAVTTHKIDVLINICTLIALIVVGTAPSDGAITALIVAEFARFFRLFFVFNDVDIFEMLVPVLMRAACLYFSMLFFFAVFAHNFFCESLENPVHPVGDDDASDWLNYADLLNFSTILQSLLTLFEMSILGNWSIVMDASARNAGVASYLFFYFFRLLMTLNVLPVLIGFIMQVRSHASC